MSHMQSHSRVRAPEVAAMLGIGVRCVQKMAAAGRLPSAARIGKIWTFDPVRIRAYLAEAEAQACQNAISISATGSGGLERHLPEGKSEKAYASAMSRLLAG